LILFLSFFLKADQEGWGELCDLYLSEHDYSKAAFCAEELILINPHNHLNHERYASICYSQGDYEKARAYYFSTIKCNPNNIRALYGIILTSANMKSRTTTENNNKIIMEQILQRYKETIPDLLPIAEKALQSFIN
jgi:tetratricopeptide (TPR) repeat protein